MKSVIRRPQISAAVRAHLFEPFYTTSSKGTGLGLYLARELCLNNGAMLNYEFRTEYAVVNVGDLAALDAKVTEVNAEVLATAGLIRPGVKSLKVLGDGEISRALKVTAQKFTGSAKAKLEKAGGQAVVA